MTPAECDQIADAAPGVVTYQAVNLTTGKTLARDADAPVRTASVIKVPIMAEAFWQVEEKRRRWDDRLTLDRKTAVGGSGILGLLSDGLELTLRDAVTLMIVLSDNTATNLVLDALDGGPGGVNARMRTLGLPLTTVFRKAFSPDDPDNPDAMKFGLGRMTAAEMCALLSRMARGELVSAQASVGMTDILKRQFYRDGIPAHLPVGWATATKSGSVEGLRNDVGLVFPPDGRGPLALAISCDDQPAAQTHGDDTGLATIAHLSAALAAALLE